MSEGRFRLDLFYRLNVFPVQLPSLRDRATDIPILVDYFATRFAARTGKKITHIEKRSLGQLQQHSWPGNVRELQNVIERCVILADGEVLQVDPDMLSDQPLPTAQPVITNVLRFDRKIQIETALRETRGKVYGPLGAAARLGLPATTLDSQIRALSINKHQYK